MRRSFGFFMAAAWLAGGCSHDGDFEVSWQFVGPSGAVETAADGCGLHGVDAILVTGSNGGGDGTNVTGLCTPGSLRRSIPPGTWTFALHTLDTHGKTIQPIDMPDGTTDAMAITEGGLTVFPPISITPRPACMDGIDNDHDGLVDLDDPDCAGDATWTDESSSKP